jgi:hypothetical protein
MVYPCLTITIDLSPEELYMALGRPPYSLPESASSCALLSFKGFINIRRGPLPSFSLVSLAFGLASARLTMAFFKASTFQLLHGCDLYT